MPTCEPDGKVRTPSDDDDSGGVLRYYQVLEAASVEMLQAARAGDWDSVCHLEGACAVVIAKVRTLVQEQPLQAHERGERMRILRRILAHDAEIRRICEPVPSMLDARAFPLRLGSNSVH